MSRPRRNLACTNLEQRISLWQKDVEKVSREYDEEEEEEEEYEDQDWTSDSGIVIGSQFRKKEVSVPVKKLDMKTGDVHDVEILSVESPTTFSLRLKVNGTNEKFYQLKR